MVNTGQRRNFSKKFLQDSGRYCGLGKTDGWADGQYDGLKGQQNLIEQQPTFAAAGSVDKRRQ